MSQYLYDQTQFGRFTIREYNSSQSDIEAEYVMTHFALDLPEQFECGIYLDGDFTHRRFDEQSQMVYNRETGQYEKTFVQDQKRDETFNEAAFGREYESKWSGSVEDAFFNGEAFDRNRILQKYPELA